MGVSPRTGDAHKGLCYKDLGAFLRFCPNAPFLDDLADYKINLLELLLVDEGIYYQSGRFGELIQPETRAVNPTGCQPSGLPRLYCLSHPEVIATFGGIVEELAELFQPDGICVWLPEHLGRCTCPGCSEKGYLAAFYQLYHDAFAKIREQQPVLRMRFLVSFLRYSDAVLVYYECDRHGLYGYDEQKHLPAHLAAAAAAGRRVLGCLSYRGCGQGYVPLPTLDTVAEWIRLCKDNAYCGVNGSVYSNPGVRRQNILQMAEAAWNAEGRNTEEFLCAYSIRHGLSHPRRRAKAMALLSNGWECYHRLLGGLMEEHALDWMLTRAGANYVEAFYLTDGLEYRDLPELNRRLSSLDEGDGIAQELGDEDLQGQFRVCRIRVGALYHLLAALHVYGRRQWPDPMKGPWEDWIEEISQHLRSARELLEELPGVTKHIRPVFPGVHGDPTVRADECLKKTDWVLSAENLERMRANAWPEISAFA